MPRHAPSEMPAVFDTRHFPLGPTATTDPSVGTSAEHAALPTSQVPTNPADFPEGAQFAHPHQSYNSHQTR